MWMREGTWRENSVMVDGGSTKGGHWWYMVMYTHGNKMSLRPSFHDKHGPRAHTMRLRTTSELIYGLDDLFSKFLGMHTKNYTEDVYGLSCCNPTRKADFF
jgi:hypothetical protein